MSTSTMTFWACSVLMKMPATKRLQTAIDYAIEHGVSARRVWVHPEDAVGMAPPMGTELIVDVWTPRGQFRFERGTARQ